MDIPSSIPNLQRWVLTSNPDNKNIWPGKTYQEFQEELPILSTKINKPIYRGTKFPWIQGRRQSLKTQTQLEHLEKKFLEAFDSHTPFILPSVTSFTTKRSLAQKFASEAKGFQLTKAITIDEGYLHVVEKGIRGVDVYKELQTLPIIKLPTSDELFTAKDEREVLLYPGTVLFPKSRKGRVFTWIPKD